MVFSTVRREKYRVDMNLIIKTILIKIIKTIFSKNSGTVKFLITKKLLWLLSEFYCNLSDFILVYSDLH